MSEQLDTPVAFIVFNRPDTTRRVFERIRAARPRMLLLISDGPRPHKVGEPQCVAESRAIAANIDWPCELLTNFSETNLGCGRRVSSGLNWLFEKVDRAIILEDDCLPDPSFFTYCATLLHRHAADADVLHISGLGPLDWKPTQKGYFATRWPFIWGWASWRRAWAEYDFRMTRWQTSFTPTDLAPRLNNDRIAIEHYTRIFDQMKAGEIDTWDYQWLFANLSHGAQGGICLAPEQNLIANIGFGANATHTTGAAPWYARPTRPLSVATNPPTLATDPKIDRWIFDHVHGGIHDRLPGRLRRAARSIFSRLRHIGISSTTPQDSRP